MLCLDWVQREEEDLEVAGDVAEKHEMLRAAEGRGQGQHREAGCSPDSLYQLSSLCVMLRLQIALTNGNKILYFGLYSVKNTNMGVPCAFQDLCAPKVCKDEKQLMTTLAPASPLAELWCMVHVLSFQSSLVLSSLQYDTHPVSGCLNKCRNDALLVLHLRPPKV